MLLQKLNIFFNQLSFLKHSPDVRTVSVRHEEIIDSLSGFLIREKLRILAGGYKGQYYVMIAEGALGKSLFGMNQQVVNIKIQPENKCTSKIELFFCFKESFRWGLFITLIVLLLGFLSFAFDAKLGFGYCYNFFMISGIILLWVNINNRSFVNRFYEEILRITPRVNVIEKGQYIPDFPLFVPIFFLFLAIFLFSYTPKIVNLTLMLSSLPYILFAILAILILSVTLSLTGIKGFSKVTFIIPHLCIAVFLIIYCMPSFLSVSFWHVALVQKPKAGVVIGVILLMYLALVVVMIVNLISISKKSSSYDNRYNLDLFIRESIPHRSIFEFLFVIFWAGCAFVVIKMAIFAFYCLKFFAVGNATFFLQIFAYDLEHNFNTWGLRIIFGLYGSIFILIIMPFFIKRFQFYKQILFLRNTSSVPKYLSELIEGLCAYAKVKRPLLLTAGEEFNTQYIYGIGSILWIPNGLLKRLKTECLQAVLAHEMYHIKKHNFIFSFLCELSEWTFFGKGFLVFALDTRKIEFDADVFAVKYLEEHNLSKKELINALAIIREESQGNISTGLKFVAQSQKKKPTTNNFLGKLKILIEFYYGDDILPYLRPSTKERQERINQL